MVSCSRKRKSECTPPCEWVVGSGCKSPSPDRASPRLRRRSCSSYRKSECSSPCEWVKGLGCRSPVQSKKSQRREKPCKPNQIRNPDTGRCVSKDGVVGRRILQHRRSRSRSRTPPPLSPLYSDYEPTSPETNPYEQTSPRRHARRRSPPSPYKDKTPVRYTMKHLPRVNMNEYVTKKYGKFIYKFISNFYKVPINQITAVKQMGKGQYGEVFMFRIIDNLIIIKFEKVKDKSLREMKNEYEMHVMFYEDNIGVPKPLFYAVSHNKKFTFVGMELDPYAVDFGFFEKQLLKPVKQYILKYMIESIDALLTRLCERGYIHKDMHWGNIGYQDIHTSSKSSLIEFPIIIDNQLHYVSPLLIDFGFSEKRPCSPDLELLQLIRTLYPFFQENCHRSNRDYLYSELLKLLDKHGKVLSSSLAIFPKQPKWSEEEFIKIDKLYKVLFYDY